MAELGDERKKLDDELEFYKKRPEQGAANAAPPARRQRPAAWRCRSASSATRKTRRGASMRASTRSWRGSSCCGRQARGRAGAPTLRVAARRSRQRHLQRRACSSRSFLLQQRVDLRRVGLALAGLHDLADQRVEGLVLAGAVCVDVLRLVASTSSMIFSSAPVSFICLRPLASMIASTSLPSPVHSASNTWRAALFEMVPSAMRAISCGQLRGRHRRLRRSRCPARSGGATISPMIQLLASLALAAGRGRGLEVARPCALLCVSCVGVVLRQAVARAR